VTAPVPAVHLDTQTMIWLHLARVDLLSEEARSTIEGGALAVSPMAVLEITYLHELGRVTGTGEDVRRSLYDQIGLVVDDTPFDQVVRTAGHLDWTRDPFDRLIAAQAMTASAQLVTADRRIRKHLPAAVW
jgi:PIN domain nuclease of toxin-antitoxin system